MWKSKAKKRILFWPTAISWSIRRHDQRLPLRFGNDQNPAVANKSYEIYLSLYQAVTGTEEERNIYKRFSRDLATSSSIDECHRGSAAADSAWRRFGNTFVGHTDRTDSYPEGNQKSINIDYLANRFTPTSWRQGIDDGFLAPYKVVRIDLDRDLTGWRPDKGMVDKCVNQIEDRIYKTSGIFGKNLVLEKRTNYCQKISDFLKQTVVSINYRFCDNIDHAERMRCALSTRTLISWHRTVQDAHYRR